MYPTAVLFFPVSLLLSALYPNAVLLLPVVLYKRADTPTAVLLVPVVLSKRAATPTAVLLVPVVLPKRADRPNSVLLLPSAPAFMFPLLNTISTSSVVPIKLVPAVVPALPVKDQPAPAPMGVCQVATPAASEVSILPAAGIPPVTCKPPATRVAVLPTPANTLVTATSPSCMVLLTVAFAALPIAVALVRPVFTSAVYPMAVLYLPSILLDVYKRQK